MSNTGACVECGHVRMIENHVAMVTRSGPGWQRWREQMARSVGAQLGNGG